ncbi:MAG: hypothetical protein ABFS18_05555 [Thermodesulfobacteriota bacterium]
MNKKQISGIISHNENQQEKHALREKITALEKEIKGLAKTTPTTVAKVVAEEPEPPPSFDLSNSSCKELAENIRQYFRYLDDQQYINSYNLQNGSQVHFKQLIDKLLANPPIVVRETDSLFTILTNTAHFYRVLGKENVLMARDIIIREADSLESSFALFNQWSITGDQCRDAQPNISLPLPKLYEYAGFFLNTLGGQSYLFRRNSHVRLLIKYYGVIVLDRANAEVINRHGIDITPPLESLINEIEIGETMVYKEQYLRTLHELQNKYQTYYDGAAAYRQDVL